MRELMILEVLIGAFLLLPLLRPLIKRLAPLEGLVWFPVLALGINIAIFPAYGFRPECIPLLIYGIVRNAIKIPAIISPAHSRNDGFRERKTALAFAGLVPLAAALFAALYFAPRAETALLTGGVEALAIKDESRGGEELFVRIYGGAAPGEQPRPLMILIPPVIGSVEMTDRLCGSLRDQGFTTLTYSRRNFDLPARDARGRRFGLSVGRRHQVIQAALQGLTSEKANAAGRALEEGRRQDIIFLLNAIRQGALRDILLRDADPDCVFAAGYGAGGAALLTLAGLPGFIRQYPVIKGIIAVESPVLSALRGKERPPPEPLRNDGWFRSFVSAIRAWAADLGERKISRMTELPKPGVPVLFLLSDRALFPRYRDTRYGTILPILRSMEQPAILAAVDGAGPLDYSDVPEKYPIYRVFFPSLRSAPPGRHSPDTAALMANFAATLMEDADTQAAIPARKNLSQQGISIETGGAWNFPVSKGIL